MKCKLYASTIVAAGLLWGTMGLFVRRFNAAGLTSVQISEIRSLVTAVILFAALALFKREYLRIRFKDIWIFIGSGLLSILLFNVCYFKAIELMSMSAAATLLYSSPAFVMILSAIFLGERITAKKVLAVIITFLGCAFVSGMIGGDSRVTWLGLLCGISSGFGYALYSIFSRLALNRGYNSVTITAYTFLFAAAGCAFLTDFSGIAAAVSRSPGLIPFSILYAVVVTVAPYMLYTLGLTRVENSRASVIVAIEPVTATVLGTLVFSERLTATTAIGILLVICGIVIVNIRTGKKTEAAENDR